MVEASPPEEQDRTPSAAARPLTSATPRQEKLSDVDIQWLYDSAVVGITRYRCLIRHRQCGAEQYQGFDTLVFPEATPFVLHQARRTSVVEPASVLFLRKDEIYRTAHPYGCGDHGTALVIHPRVLEEVAQGLGATDFASIPLTTWPLPPKAQLRLTGLLHFLEGSPGTPEPLGVEERSLALAAEIAVVPFRLIGRKTKATRRARDLAEDVKDLIVRHLPHRISLPEMAAQLETSPFTLCRAFKRQTG